MAEDTNEEKTEETTAGAETTEETTGADTAETSTGINQRRVERRIRRIVERVAGNAKPQGRDGE